VDADATTLEEVSSIKWTALKSQGWLEYLPAMDLGPGPINGLGLYDADILPPSLYFIRLLVFLALAVLEHPLTVTVKDRKMRKAKSSHPLTNFLLQVRILYLLTPNQAKQQS
jgi:hypothetical protein